RELAKTGCWFWNQFKIFNMRSLVVIFLLLFSFISNSQVKIILDADTGNEMDDLYAIVRCFDDDVELTGLISAHFNNVQLLTDSVWNGYSTKNINSLQLSQMENELLLEQCKMTHIPHPAGCEKMVGFAWGFYPGAQVPTSAGVDFIIEHAKKASPENKVNIVTLGAVTNVAAAILHEPSIAKNIRLYALNMKYNVENKAWNKNSFNARNDVNGLDVILNNIELELWVIPGNVSSNLKFQRKDTQEKLANFNNAISKNLSDRWDAVNAKTQWIMWDVALIEAIIHPEYASVEKTLTPPENIQREIMMYTSIDAKKMRDDFWQSYDKLMKKLK
ncbi:MAG: nucleoside hydrolase, partial [Draconibacterium sp.]|nr:nucleoside hydrolase [Draconibacterium sp.]